MLVSLVFARLLSEVWVYSVISEHHTAALWRGTIRETNLRERTRVYKLESVALSSSDVETKS